MAQTDHPSNETTSLEEIQKGWRDLISKVSQLEAERSALEHDNKSLRFLLERVIEHRQKSHGELVQLLAGLVSKLPINDVGVVVSKLIEHNTHVSEVCAVLAKGKVDAALPQPAILKALEQTKHDLIGALKSTVEELIQLDTAFDPALLRSLIEQPELFFSPPVLRATRGFIKGQIPRERIVKEFGDAALTFFNDVTTDRKLNPNPKPEEIALAFKNDFEALLQQDATLPQTKKDELVALYQKIQRGKAATGQTRAQRNSFLKLSFILELLHYYQNQSTEAPDVIFAQRLPALIEQFVIASPQDSLDEKLIQQAESLLAFIVGHDHRQAVINNMGKGGGVGKTLKYVLTLRSEKVSEPDQIVTEFVKHLIPLQKAPPPETIAAVLRLLKPERQRLVVFGVMDSDRIGKSEAEALGKKVGEQLGLPGLDAPRKVVEKIPPELERQLAWEKIKELFSNRADPTLIAAAIRDRLRARYDTDEMKQSWLTLTEVDPILLIRVFCQLPYLADGSTDPVARTVMETYVTRLTHEKYGVTYNKVLTSLKNMFKANPNSPTLLNFLALVKWLDAAAANKLSLDIGMAAPV